MIKVIYTRTNDTFISLEDRAKIANQEKVDIFVSIHINAAENVLARGVETFSYPNSRFGGKLSKAIQDSLVNANIFTKNRGTKTANFAVLRLTNMEAALTELGFISNREDANLINSRIDDISKHLAIGILNHIGDKKDVKICLDPGHGGKDPGAVGHGFKEKDFTLAIAKKVGEILTRGNTKVDISDYAFNSSLKAVKAGIFVDGDSDGHIDNPKDPVTREQLVVVLDRLGLLDKR